MSSKSYSIQKTIQNLLGTVGISKTDISFTDAMHADVSVHYTQLWNFEPVYKDTVVKAAPENPKPTDELLSVEDLRQFKTDKLKVIKEGIMIKKPFCNRLEKLSAKELFELGNKINRLSNQHAKGLEVCPDCKGSLKVNCKRCSGIGKVLCPSCQGKEGGCSACNKTGYIECPSCKGARKQPCTKCKGSGYVIVDTEVFCQAVCTNHVEIEFENKNFNFEIPVVTVEPCCIQAIVCGSLKFYLNESEYKDDNSYELKLTAKTQLSFLKFCLVGISKIFTFWTVGPTCVELCRPKVLDLSYSILKNELGDAAVGTTVGNIKSKMALIEKLSKDPFFSTLLHAYELDYDSVTKRLNTDSSVQNTYSSEVFALKKRLESIVAVRKEELARTLQNRLLTSTHGLMSEYFAKDCCMSLVEFMTNLKYRPKSVPRAWNMATLFMWGLTLFISALLPLSGLLFGCFLLSAISCVLVSYFGTKNLLIYEFCFRKRLFYNPLKFLDLNYDAFRSLILLAGVIILEVGVYLIH